MNKKLLVVAMTFAGSVISYAETVITHNNYAEELNNHPSLIINWKNNISTCLTHVYYTGALHFDDCFKDKPDMENYKGTALEHMIIYENERFYRSVQNKDMECHCFVKTSHDDVKWSASSSSSEAESIFDFVTYQSALSDRNTYKF